MTRAPLLPSVHVHRSRHARFSDIKTAKRTQARNPEKRQAHITLNNALKSGLVRGYCDVCQRAVRLQAHHEDYAKPMGRLGLHNMPPQHPKGIVTLGRSTASNGMMDTPDPSLPEIRREVAMGRSYSPSTSRSSSIKASARTSSRRSRCRLPGRWLWLSSKWAIAVSISAACRPR
jgi:hypothetical protein